MPRTTEKEWDPNDDSPDDDAGDWKPDDEEWRDDDDFGSPGDDPEGPDEHDIHIAGKREPDFVTCPNCGKQIMANVEKCSYCGEWFADQAWHSQVSGRSPKHRTWIVIAAVAVLAAIALSIYFVGGMREWSR